MVTLPSLGQNVIVLVDGWAGIALDIFKMPVPYLLFHPTGTSTYRLNAAWTLAGLIPGLFIINMAAAAAA